MAKTKEFNWNVENGTRLDLFLREKFHSLDDEIIKNLSNSKIRRFIVSGNVYVNKSRCPVPSFDLKPGDKVFARVQLDRIAFEKQPDDNTDYELTEKDVLYEDEWIIVVNKPPFVPTEETIVKDRISMHGCVVSYLWKKNPSLRNPPYAGVLHRLDRETSGVLLMTKTRSVNKEFSAMFQNHLVEKKYRAVCTKSPEKNQHKNQHEKKEFTVEFFMGRITPKSSACKMGPLPQAKGGLWSKTDFYVAGEKDGFYYVDAKLYTGRTHQIRTHLSQAWLPILGDTLYGGRQGIKAYGQRIMLHAKSLSFIHPVTNEKLTVEAPLPKGFDF